MLPWARWPTTAAHVMGHEPPDTTDIEVVVCCMHGIFSAVPARRARTWAVASICQGDGHWGGGDVPGALLSPLHAQSSFFPSLTVPFHQIGLTALLQ